MMTEYSEAVERQRLLIEAEKWAEGTANIHAHSMNSMWYDNRPEDTEGGKSVMDITYNSGLIERRLDNGRIVYFGKKLTGDALIQEYIRKNSDKPKKRYVYI